MPELIALLPAATPSPNEMLRSTIVYRHNNRYLYPDQYIGEVLAMKEYTGKSAPQGTYLFVKSPTFNLPSWIHESDFVGYARTVNAKAAAA